MSGMIQPVCLCLRDLKSCRPGPVVGEEMHAWVHHQVRLAAGGCAPPTSELGAVPTGSLTSRSGRKRNGGFGARGRQSGLEHRIFPGTVSDSISPFTTLAP